MKWQRSSPTNAFSRRMDLAVRRYRFDNACTEGLCSIRRKTSGSVLHSGWIRQFGPQTLLDGALSRCTQGHLCPAGSPEQHRPFRRASDIGCFFRIGSLVWSERRSGYSRSCSWQCWYHTRGWTEPPTDPPWRTGRLSCSGRNPATSPSGCPWPPGGNFGKIRIAVVLGQPVVDQGLLALDRILLTADKKLTQILRNFPRKLTDFT